MSSLNYRLWVTGLFGASLSLFGLGCATGSAEIRHGAGAGYWEDSVVTLPARQSPIASLAFGRGGSSEPASDLGLDDAFAALDSAPVRADAHPTTALRSAKLMAAKQAAEPVQVVQADVQEQTTQPAVETAAPVAQPALVAANTQDTQASRYAAREAASEEQQKFAAGDAIVITSGAVVLVLLIVLLVLLLR